MAAVLLVALLLPGCVTKVVTTPVKVAYKTAKYTTKGAVAVGRAVVPGDRDDQK